ncbi:WbqC family protein [Ponticoccus litoralis]|uniref:WbqC family protein n=1 Tax=Ponticoccus litoralis TaxID=422297 RepID=A0AAW9SP14_9RHOB
MRVAVMQPYLYPYLGYFHLIASVDLFLIFDCVQFPRRGRVHRAPVPQKEAWLTLPLARQPRDTLISELAFAENAEVIWRERLDRLPWMAQAPALRATLTPLRTGRVSDYLAAQLIFACDALGIGTKIQLSSSYRVTSKLQAQDRVIALAHATGATSYVNLPGGRSLYDAAAFSAAGLSLSFVSKYNGPFQSMLHALATQPYPRLRSALAELPAPSAA